MKVLALYTPKKLESRSDMSQFHNIFSGGCFVGNDGEGRYRGPFDEFMFSRHVIVVSIKKRKAESSAEPGDLGHVFKWELCFHKDDATAQGDIDADDSERTSAERSKEGNVIEDGEPDENLEDEGTANRGGPDDRFLGGRVHCEFEADEISGENREGLRDCGKAKGEEDQPAKFFARKSFIRGKHSEAGAREENGLTCRIAKGGRSGR